MPGSFFGYSITKIPMIGIEQYSAKIAEYYSI
jgi:hypothetical protein